MNALLTKWKALLFFFLKFFPFQEFDIHLMSKFNFNWRIDLPSKEIFTLTFYISSSNPAKQEKF